MSKIVENCRKLSNFLNFLNFFFHFLTIRKNVQFCISFSCSWCTFRDAKAQTFSVHFSNFFFLLFYSVANLFSKVTFLVLLWSDFFYILHTFSEKHHKSGVLQRWWRARARALNSNQSPPATVMVSLDWFHAEMSN